MALVNLNSALRSLRGKVDGWVYKQYRYGTVVSRVPRMGKVKPSAAQLAHRERVKEAGVFYREVLRDPKLKARYSKIARKKGIPLPAVTLAMFFRRDRDTRNA